VLLHVSKTAPLWYDFWIGIAGTDKPRQLTSMILRAISSLMMFSSCLMPTAAAAGTFANPGLLGDPIALNIGLGCGWQDQCIAAQKRAMTKSLKFVAKYRPPEWRVHLCNRNAARSSARVDWVGFDHCVRNEALRPPPPPPLRAIAKAKAKRTKNAPLKRLPARKKARGAGA